LPQAAIDRAKAEPGKAFVLAGTLYLATTAGNPLVLARGTWGGDIDEATVTRGTSRDGKWLTFVRDTGELKVQYAGDPYRSTELWIVSTNDGHERRLLTHQPEVFLPGAGGALMGFMEPQFSPDHRLVYFQAPAWATSLAVYSIDIATLQARFISDANCLLIVPAGKHQGQLLASRHKYKPLPGGAFDWCGFMDSHGRELATVTSLGDSCSCGYYSSADWRIRVDQVLGISSSKAPP
jgi:hypothetical protein